jgi:TM2 domain-containing membrane protein YozV
MTDDWHFTRNKERQGPVAFAKLKEMAREGWLIRDDLVWHSGLKEWTPAAQVQGLFGTSVSQMFQQAISGNGEPKPAGNDPAARPPEMPVKISKQKIKLDRSRQSSVNWHDLAPRHVLAACGGFLATLGIAFTVIAQSRLALAFTLSGLCIAAVGLSVEIGQLLGQAVHNIGTASKEAADRRLRAQEIALEKRRLDLEVAQLAQQDKHLERILPAAPFSASAQAQMALAPLVLGDSPAGGNVVVINQPPARLWSPGFAAVLSFFLPGLGQLYKGQFINGVAWFFMVMFGYAALILPGLILHFFCVLGALSGNPWGEAKTTVVRQ